MSAMKVHTYESAAALIEDYIIRNAELEAENRRLHGLLDRRREDLVELQDRVMAGPLHEEADRQLAASAAVPASA